MTDTADPRVDAYIAALPAWQQALCREVRALLHAADPAVSETIKRTDRPYFVLQGNIAALQAAKDHVTIFLYDGGLTPDPAAGLITGGHGNATGRTIAIRQGETLNAPAFTAMVHHIIATNRAGLAPGEARRHHGKSGERATTRITPRLAEHPVVRDVGSVQRFRLKNRAVACRPWLFKPCLCLMFVVKSLSTLSKR